MQRQRRGTYSAHASPTRAKLLLFESTSLNFAKHQNL
jgi:hypothetical protein